MSKIKVNRVSAYTGQAPVYDYVRSDGSIGDLGELAYSRSIAQVNVKDYPFFAKGDGVTNDTLAIQAALDAVNGGTAELFFPPGIYICSNLQIGAVRLRGVWRQSIIRALDSGDASYLIAHSSYLSNSTSSNNPTEFHEMVIDANGFKQNAFIFRGYYSKFYSNVFRGSTSCDFLYSTSTQNSTQLSSTSVNNWFVDNWFGADAGTAQYNFRVVDPNSKATDSHFIGNYASSGSIANISIATAAGWDVAGNHTYTAPVGLVVQRPSVGTRVRGNYFENDVRVGSMLSGFQEANIGPGNYFATALRADFGNFASPYNTIISHANRYGKDAELQHNYFSAAQILVSVGDVFGKATPFVFMDGDGVVNNGNTGTIKAFNAVITPINQVVSTSFTGPTKPSTFESREAIGFRRSARSNINASAAVSVAATCQVPAVNASVRVMLTIAARVNHDGTLRAGYSGTFNVVRKSGTTYGITKCAESINAPEFSVAPALSTSVTGETLTITASATLANADGYGNAIIDILSI